MKRSEKRVSERGSAGTKLVIFVAILVLTAHAGYNYVPVAYNAQSLKSDMDTAILQGMAMPGKINPVDNVKERISKALITDNAPQGATLDVRQVGNGMTARVTFQHPVNILPFGMYKYNYVFDYTSTPTGYLLKQ